MTAWEAAPDRHLRSAAGTIAQLWTSPRANAKVRRRFDNQPTASQQQAAAPGI
jgi:hypothetical protein